MIEKLSSWKWSFIFVFCIIFIIISNQPAAAQSGRKNNKSNVISQDTPAARTVESEVEKTAPQVKITSLKIVGKLEHDSYYFRSNDFKDALKELEKDLSQRYRFSLKVEQGEKMDFEQAKELAKTETETFILWIGFVAKNGSSGVMYFDFAQYALLKPQTAEFVAKGNVEPRYSEFANRGGILLPTASDKRMPFSRGMKESVRQLEVILQKGGWFD